MPLIHQTTIFNIDQFAIYPMTADVTTNPAYGAAVPVPGIKTVGLDPDMLAKELYGDAKMMGRAAKVRQMNCSLTHAKLNLDALNIIAGGAVVDAGTTPNQTSTWNLLGANFPGYFKAEFRILQVDFVLTGLASLNVQLWKCKTTNFGLPLGTAEDFTLPTIAFSAIPTISNDKLVSVVFNETAAALPA